jgi:hypothetical protein
MIPIEPTRFDLPYCSSSSSLSALSAPSAVKKTTKLIALPLINNQ